VARFIHVGKSLHYRIRGRGEYLLLVHGLGSSGADWELQARALEQRFRVIVPDLPGSGNSAPLAGRCTIAALAQSLWALLDHLCAPRINIIGFSLGGAIGLEMALQRPDCVPRLALINSLASYRIDHWRKWLEARVPPVLMRLIGMRRTAWLVAARLFPHPWQRALRLRAAAVVGAVPTSCYVGMASALEAWNSTDRLDRLRSKTLMIAAEHDFTPLAEKRALAAALKADIVVVRGSRHGTPFDSIEATNACLMALLCDRPLPTSERWICDGPAVLQDLAIAGCIAQTTAPPLEPSRSVAADHGPALAGAGRKTWRMPAGWRALWPGRSSDVGKALRI
jgi:3-oxoadipate enol-lactonase